MQILCDFKHAMKVQAGRLAVNEEVNANLGFFFLQVVFNSVKRDQLSRPMAEARRDLSESALISVNE